MISHLPKIFAEITTIHLVDGVIEENCHLLLVDFLCPERIRGINENATRVDFEILGEMCVTENPKVVNIKFLDTESDQYQEFVTSVDFADMQHSIAKLSKVVCQEFEQILKRCPENYESLFKQLELHVLSK
jgi:hypothetical protein